MTNLKDYSLQTDCYICGCPATDTHHLLHGSMRAKADKYGLTVRLCRNCHNLLHDKGVMDRELQRLGQSIFEETHTREDFIKEFGKSYL